MASVGAGALTGNSRGHAAEMISAALVDAVRNSFSADAALRSG